ncbi:hypothetical protein [Klebsiella oxytoca]|uniref:hypothetical protein n=1 Tax=Klebsiella oxytoca TaxID=571 RepID=UPI0021E609CC|nr:hypothetical protein [Klebsiella oxytoca]UYH04714.1 hypothetical protein NQA44_26700 [Klebsiella oxytoca]
MMDARKLLINLLYPASAQSSEVPGWSHREIKKPVSYLHRFFISQLSPKDFSLQEGGK